MLEVTFDYLLICTSRASNSNEKVVQILVINIWNMFCKQL